MKAPGVLGGDRRLDPVAHQGIESCGKRSI
jgi:hypothetical protein